MNDTQNELSRRNAWWMAIKNDDRQTLSAMLADGYDIEDLNSRSETPFFVAAANGNIGLAQWLADQGADVKATDLSGLTPIHVAVRRSAFREIGPLAQLGVDVDAQDVRGSTALMLAAASDKTPFELVEALLAASANPNIKAKSGSTPLLAAAANSDMRSVRALLAAGADHTAIGVRGSILHSLMESSAKDAEDVAIEMINKYKDLDIDQVSRAGSTPLAFAVARNSKKAVKAFLRAGANPNARAASKLGPQMTALMMLSISEFDEEAFKLAFANGADPHLRDDSNGFNALAYALRVGISEAELEALEKTFANLPKEQIKQAKEDLGKIVDKMVWDRRFAVIDALIEGGADPKASLCGDGFSAYLSALAIKEKEMRLHAIEALSSRGFAMHPGRASTSYHLPKDEWAQDPGVLAMVNFHDEDTVEALLSAGLDPSRQSELDGLTMLHSVAKVSLFPKEQAAIALARRKILNMSGDEEKEKEAIASLQAQVDELVNGLDKWRVDMFNRLVDVAGNVDVPDQTGLSPLGYFVANGVSALAEAALARGADPFMCDKDGDNIISVAIKSGNIEWLHRLVATVGADHPKLNELFLDMTYTSPEAGSRVPFINAIQSLTEADGGVARWLEVPDENGNTPLIVAAATKQEDLVDTFLVMGANPNIQAKDGNTALHHAVSENRGDIVKALLACGADPQIKNKAGKNAMDLAIALGSPYVVRALNSDDHEKPKFELNDEVKKLVETGKEKAAKPVPRRSSPGF